MKRTALLIASLLALAACGQSSPNQPSKQTYTTLGTVQLFEEVGAGPVVEGFAVSAGFASITPTTLPSEDVRTDLLDNCIISTSSGDIPSPFPDGPSGTALDAGTALTLRSGSATITTLARNGTLYSATLKGSVPAQLNLDIPGATGGYPAQSGVPIPALPASPFIITGPANLAQVTPSTTFTWNGTNDPDRVVYLYLKSSTNQNSGYICYARDDGNFTAPATFQSAATSAGLTQLTFEGAVRASEHYQVVNNQLFNFIGVEQFLTTN